MANIKVYETSGSEKEQIDFKFDTTQKPVCSPEDYSLYVRVLRQNGRQGTVGCKGRGDVSFSNKKPWKQKGTGNARAGTRRSPLWRKGGVIFGPQPRTRTLKVNKNNKKTVFLALFSEMLKTGLVYCIDHDFSKKETPKTKEAYDILKKLKLNDRMGILFLNCDDVLGHASFRNIPHLKIFSFDQPNAYDLSSVGYWMFFKKDYDSFREMVEKWI